jgi:hypothetical protein
MLLASSCDVAPQRSNGMASEPSARRGGNAFLFYLGIIFVALCVAGGIYYLLPGVYHPFSTDTTSQHYAHATQAGALFVLAVLGLIVVRANRPPSSDGTTIQ